MEQIVKKITVILGFCLLIGQAFLPVFAEDDFKGNLEEIKTQAYALYNTNNSEEALKILNTLPSSIKDADTYIITANIYEDRKDLNKAIDNLNSALTLDPENYKAYYNLGCIFLNKKAYNLAEKNLLLAAKYNKDFPWTYYNLGTLYLREGKYAKAKKNLLKAIYLKGDEKDFYLNLAYAYKFLGKEKEAKRLIELYNKAD